MTVTSHNPEKDYVELLSLLRSMVDLQSGQPIEDGQAWKNDRQMLAKKLAHHLPCGRFKRFEKARLSKLERSSLHSLITAPSRCSRGLSSRTSSCLPMCLVEQGVIGAGMVERMAKMRVIHNILIHEPGATICLPEGCMAAAGVVIDLAVRDPAVGFVFKQESSARF